MPARNFLRHNWPAITIAVTAVAIAGAGFVMLRNMPPHRLMCTPTNTRVRASWGVTRNLTTPNIA